MGDDNLPPSLSPHTLRLLAFDAVRAEVAELALGAPGERAVCEDTVSVDGDEVTARLDLVEDWRDVLTRREGPPDAAIPDIVSVFPVLEKEGTVLDAEQLAAVSLLVDGARKLASAVAGTPQDRPLARRVATLPDLRELRRAISACITDTGEFNDDAVPELRRLRGRMRGIETRIERRALSYLRDPDQAQYWTSDTPTQRSGRTVLPLSANYRNRVKGIVHETSQTGATLFVEPPDLVELNNELREARAAYDQEIHRILRDLTETVRRRRDELSTLEAETASLDAMLARARYGHRHECTRARLAEEGALTLTGARHPLLRGAVVPIDVHVDPPARGLIITGPNTGGKTVALKTVGLLALMNQFGLEVPADEGSALPIFDGVFADIGDEQSIEQSLSTFSGHMTTIGAVLGKAGSRGLVLLDELGAGTDPEEGSALAMAILDRLAELGAVSIVTTHHGALKNYAYRSVFFENASVEFDPERLTPTYHLLIGVPGTSHALEIAGRNGLPLEVVERAREYVREGQGDEARIIEDLTEKQMELHRAARTRDAELADLRRRRAEVEEQSRRLADRELALRKNGLREFQQLSRDTRQRLENLVREIREGELTKEKTSRVRDFLDELSRTGDEEQERVEEAERLQARARHGGPRPALEPGMEVLVGESGRRGVIRRRGKGDTWVVETGNLRAELHAAQLWPAETATEAPGEAHRPARHGTGYAEKAPADSASVSVNRPTARPALELDLRGYRMQEALDAVDRQIDDCLLSGLDRFSVIHGKGGGILRKGIRDHLDERDEVEHYEFARPEEGGYGKTVVHLRQP
ncbi:MAG: endonuclease MutS2 [Spirochaetaceae bacterium]